MGNTLYDVLIIFGSFVLLVFLSFVCKKIYYRLVHKKRFYIFPRLSTKGITNIAMTIAIATAILLLLTVLSSGLLGVLFRAYPGWRVNIESILIKVGGLCFGPIIGLFVGFSTDLLSVALTAGMFHYGYCIAASLFGLLSGLILTLRNFTKNNKLFFHLCAVLFLTFTFVIQFVFFNFMVNLNDPKITGGTIGAISIDILGISAQFKLWMINLYLFILFIGCLLIIWFAISKNDRYFIIYKLHLGINRVNVFYTYILYKRFFKKGDNIQQASDRFLKWNYEKIDKQSSLIKRINNLKAKSDAYKNNRAIDFVSVFLCIVACENLIGTVLVPSFDVQFSALPLGYWLSVRLISMIPSILLNFAVLYPIYKIIVPTMKYNYMSDTSEDLDVPYLIG